jgi:hypothetical protein
LTSRINFLLLRQLAESTIDTNTASDELAEKQEVIPLDMGWLLFLWLVLFKCSRRSQPLCSPA